MIDDLRVRMKNDFGTALGVRACHQRSAWLRMAGLVVLVFVAGCGRTGPPTATLEGSVTLDGKPLEKGTISFVSQEKTGGSATAEIVAGPYRAEHVPRGKVLVYLHATKDTGRMVEIMKGSPQQEIINIVPEKYRAGITIEVTEPVVHRDFDLVGTQ
jgi:hypothetical protein